MFDQEIYSAFLEQLYRATVEPQQWERAIELCADILGGYNACLLDLDLYSGSGSRDGVIARVDPRMPGLYEEHFASINPLLHVADVNAYLNGWDLRVLTDEDWMAKSDLIRTEYYNDFLKPQDVHSCMMIRLAVGEQSVASLSINRPIWREQFSPAETAFASTMLQRHLVNAYDLSCKFASLTRLSEDLGDALELSPMGVFFVDETARIRHANRAAERMMADSLGVLAREGRLTAHWPEAAHRLAGLIKSATALEPELRRGGTIALPSPRRSLPLSLTVAPVTSDRLSLFTRGRSAVVCISDLESGASIPEQTLRELFFLTRAEAKVAMALFEGASPRQAAANLGLSINTVRVHMGSIFSKTGTNRQADFLRLMLRAVGTAGYPG